MQSIVLIGPMGVGKTTIGKKLSKMVDLPFVDTDQLFTKQHGAISEFFEKHGERAFREIEEDIVANALVQPAVLATGGGVVLSDHTRTLLQEFFVVYLATDGRHMHSRLSGGNRPLLKNGIADWRRIYDSRKSLYEEVATVTVDTSNAQLASILETIQEEYRKHDKH